MTSPRSQLRLTDVGHLGLLSIRARPLRAALSGLGVAIGIACVVAVLGVSASSQARLLDEIDALGTNLLTVTAGRTLDGQEAALPDTAPAMISRIEGVQQVAYIGAVRGGVYRHEEMPAGQGGGLSIQAVSLSLPATLQVPVASGTWLNEATARFPATVLGTAAARRLGIAEVHGNPRVYLAGEWFTVVGILGPSPLDRTLEQAALVGVPVAAERLGFDGHPTKIYERSTDETVTSIRTQLSQMANPEHPDEVELSRPSDALVARAAAQRVYTSLWVGLGGVALLVGSIGIANVMVIGVLERRGEIGLRRALGATRQHVRWQFLVESVLLSAGGGMAGAVLGAAVTVGYAVSRDWAVVVPGAAITGGLVASVVSGVVAGIYPAARAARMSPAEALRVV